MDERQGGAKVIFDAGVGHHVLEIQMCHSRFEDDVQWLEEEQHWEKDELFLR